MLYKLIAALLAVAFVSGCNTMQGAGEDIERGGEMIQDAASKKK